MNKKYTKARYLRRGWPAQARPDALPPEGWSLPMLAGMERIYNSSLSPDGKRLAFIWHRDKFCNIFLVLTEGSWPKQITFDRPATQYWWDEIPRWSPDGNKLAFCIKDHVYYYDLSAAGLPQKISGFAPKASNPRWLNDNERLVISIEREDKDQLLITDFNGSWPRLLAAGEGDNRDANPSPDGKWVAYTHRPLSDLNRLEIMLAEVASAKNRPLTGTPGRKNWSPRWASDSNTLAYLSNRSGFSEIWLMDLAAGEERQLTHAGCDLADIAWSPDGRWLACSANRNGSLELVLADGTDGSLHDLHKIQGIHSLPEWMPDGKGLVYDFCSATQPPEFFKAKIDVESKVLIQEKDISRISRLTPPALTKLNMVTPEHIDFKNPEGLEIHGMLYQPVKPNHAGIVHVHGGPRGQAMHDWDGFQEYLLAKGYTILDVNYRGSTGYGYDFEMLNQENWGIGDTKDCLAAADYLAGLDTVDDHRLAIMGGSYGGYMTFCAMSMDTRHRFACGVAIYGDGDIFNSWALCERDTRLYTEMMLDHPAKKRDIYEAGSCIRFVKDIQKPLLLFHGLDDRVVPTESSEEMVEELKKLGKTFEYKTYAGESHGFLKRKTRLDFYSRIETFLDWYLMPVLKVD